MTNSLVDSGGQPERVRSYLRKALPDCELTSEPLVSGYPPLTLMWMTHLMAAFAFSNGDTGKSYAKLYRSFKEYYANNRERLDAFDLSFVFCVRPDLPDLDKFSSKVETDVYFCRKFVVPLAPRLDRSFERLPFLPLALDGRPSGRPPSAQTYMRQCGVPAVLARYLAVPHQRGAENIVRDCIENKSNWTSVLASQGGVGTPGPETERDAERVRLESVHIESFRAYKKPQTFRLGTAVTVVYGPNGFGKTSLFDAIDFAATGGIGRLGLVPSNDLFAKVVSHLDGKPGDAGVSLNFGTDGARRRIRRQVVSRMHASLDGSSCDRKRALAEITGGGATPADRVEHFVSLFRATHLYSQEHQELAKEFDRDCALPAHVVAHMLAFEDYASARKKASSVCEILGETVAKRRNDIRGLASEVEEAERELRRLVEPAEGHGDAARPTDALQMLRQRVEEMGLAVKAEESDKVFVRLCRAAIQARLTEGEARVARLAALAEQVNALPAVRDGLGRLVERRTRLESEAREAEGALVVAEETQEKANARVRELEEKRSRARFRVELAGWARVTQPRYAELRRREAGSVEAGKEARGIVAELRELRSSAKVELRRRQQESAALAETLSKGRKVVAELGEVVGAEAGWRRDRTRIVELKTEETARLRRLEELRTEWRSVAPQLKAVGADQQRVEREIAEIERGRSDLAELMSGVEGYIADGHCPLCGHDHGSLEELVGRIEKRRVQEGAVGPRAELGRLREARKKLELRLTETRRSADGEGASVEELRTERAECAARIVAFEEAAGKLGLSVQEPAAVRGQIDARREQGENEIREMEGANRTFQEVLQRARTNIADVERKIEEAEKAAGEAELEADNCREGIAELRADRRADQLSLDTEPASLGELEKGDREELKRMEAAFGEAVEAARNSREVRDGRRQRVARLASSLGDLKREIGARRRTVAETRARLMEYGIAADADEAEVVRLLDKETKVNGQVAELGDFADSVEVALDTASTAAALQQQGRAIRHKERRIEAAKRDVEVHDAWRRYFAELVERLSDQQHEAVTSFAEGYGSMASAIQQRLRSVYGFHGIDTRSHEATIRVRVRRGDESLKPTDYFSHSQQQTLLLGLFLTACISQTWSSLSTVLLDDPVTHFDDLNTYAFLDMILGLLSAGSGPQQFIISTCDQKVFDLARSKFRHLEADAVFYGLSAIGSDGPVVEEIGPV